MQLPVPAHLAGRPSRCSVIFAQELVMEPDREHTQDLDRVIRIRFVHRLGAHTHAGYQREVSYQRMLIADARPCQRTIPQDGDEEGRRVPTRSEE
jgi:hypothetical protein